MKTVLKFISKCRVVLFLALLFLPLCNALAGSLWREGITDERGMFSDKRAKKVGDIVTIIIQESAAVSNTLSMTTKKSAKSESEGLASNIINQFVSALPDFLLNKKFPDSDKTFKPPTLSSNGDNSFSSGGTIQNSQTITARVAVQVIDVLPNGNLVVEGLREISFSKERQFATLHGIIRAYDILPDNTVLSGNVADAQIQIVSEGSLTDVQKKGWLRKLDEKISPY
jgi:flagellar L-ring protein precursor FlgH